MVVRIAQLIVTRNIQKNLLKMIEVLNSSKEGEWVIFPEGMLSGYYPEQSNFLKELNFEEIAKGIKIIQAEIKKKKCSSIFGTAYYLKDKWYNASIFIDGSQLITYFKNNLATLDKKHFEQGNKIETYESHGIKFGIQMCRELVFPEQWKLLKRKRAQVVFYINNSIKPEDEVRNHLLLARAFENQYFVCSVNNAEKPQKMSSWVISPNGGVLYQATPQKESIVSVDINLSKVENTYLNQERNDLVKLVSNERTNPIKSSNIRY